MVGVGGSVELDGLLLGKVAEELAGSGCASPLFLQNPKVMFFGR